ncbi:MAG: hypothetical protein ACRDGQ_06730 [Candidatus Limnocylindrales bacterium]
MSSNIAAIVDYSATVAARVQDVALANGEIGGVRSVYGGGMNLYADPLRPGEMIQPSPEKPLEPFTHMTDLPDAPTITPLTQEGSVQLEWNVPMRFYVPRGDLATARQTLLPFYDAYEAAFWPDRRLGGLCLLAYIRSMGPAQADSDWAWCPMVLYVLEEVDW